MKNPLLKLKLADIRKYRRQSKLEQSASKVKIVHLTWNSSMIPQCLYR